MSIVGPRPALPAEVATYNDYQRQRLLVKPGMTCYWQTRRNRDSITFDEWVDLDLWCGFWADFLEDATLVDGRRVYTHERLRKARRSLSLAGLGGDALHLPRPRAHEGRPAPFDQQQDRGRRQRPAQGYSPQPQGAHVPEAREGRVLVVPRAFRRREDRQGEAGDHAEGRRHRPALRGLLVIPEARRWEAGMG